MHRCVKMWEEEKLLNFLALKQVININLMWLLVSNYVNL